MIIRLDPELAAALIEQARRQGASPEALALEALRARFLAPSPSEEAEDEWVRRLRRVATDCGVSLPDAALSSEAIYE
jgi:predicted transcriptional regulator